MATHAFNIKRREFIKTGLAGTAGVGLSLINTPLSRGASRAKIDDAGPLPMRILGRTNERVTVVGLGGGRFLDEASAKEIIETCMALGINYYDNAHNYVKGLSEEWYGKYLKPVRRKVIITSKTGKRDAKSAMEELEISLKRLQTDYIDLYQFHGLTSEDDLKKIFGPGGAAEAFEKARQDGKIRYIGVTGHADPNVNRKALDYYEYDTMLLPINVLDHHYFSFREACLEELVKKNTGIVVMKPFVANKALENNVATEAECLQYVLTQPVALTIPGCTTADQMVRNAAVARTFRPLSDSELNNLLAKTEKFKGPQLESYKRKLG